MKENKISVRYATNEDKEFWQTLDKRLPKTEFEITVRNNRGYIISKDDAPIGIPRHVLP